MTTNGDISGEFESVSARFARGWAVAPDEAGPVKLELVDAGQVVAEGTTGLPRPDVERRTGSARAGFRIPLPPRLTGLGALSVRAAGSAAALARAVAFATAPDLTARLAVGEDEREQGHGHIDRIEGLRVHGWAARRGGDGPVEVLFYLRHKLVGAVHASLPRPDVAAAGLGPLESGFEVELRLPSGIAGGEITARVRDAPQPLKGGVFTIWAEATVADEREPEADPSAFLAAASVEQEIAFGFEPEHPVQLRAEGDEAAMLAFEVTRLGVVARERLALPTAMRGDLDRLLAPLVLLGTFGSRRDDRVALAGGEPVALLTRPNAFDCLRLQDDSGPVVLRDAELTSPHRLRLRLTVNNDPMVPRDATRVRVLQLASGGLRLAPCGEARPMPSLGPVDLEVEAVLPDPFRPILIAVLDNEDELLDLDLLPFPSLCRGGWHEPELRASSDSLDEFATLARLSSALMERLWRRGEEGVGIALDAARMVATEPGVTTPIRNWIRTHLGGEFGLAQTLEAGEAEEHWTGLPTIPAERVDALLPADAIPTLSLLVSPRGSGEACAAGYVSVGIDDPADCWRVGMPPFGPWLRVLQPEGSETWCPWVRPGEETPTLAAVRYSRRRRPLPPTTLFPSLRRDAGGGTIDQPVTLLVSADPRDPDRAVQLEALAQQTIAARCDILIVQPREAALPDVAERHFPGRARPLVAVDPSAALLAIARGRIATSEVLAVCNPGVIPHDAVTLERLIRVATDPRVGWVGCPTVTGSINALMPSGWGAGTVGVSTVDGTKLRVADWPVELLPDAAAFPVGLIDPALMVIAVDKLARLQPGGEAIDDWIAAAVAADLTNLCLTEVAAHRTTPREPREWRDGPRLRSLDELESVLCHGATAQRRPR